MAGVTRGAATILVAKVVFLLAGYVLYATLGRLLTTEEFGVYGVVFGVVSAVNMVLINGTLQTVSRFVATHPGAESSVRWRALRYQVVVVLILVGGFFVAAPWIAAALNDEQLTEYFQLATLIMTAYAFYAVNVGYLNGRQFFGKQGGLDIGFALLRVALIVLAVLAFGGVASVILGFAAAAFVILAISFPVAGFARADQGATYSLKAFAGFTVSLMSVAFFQNLLLSTDLFVLKSTSAPEVADRLAGLYTAAQSIARIPYYLMATASLVLFPMIARLSADDETSRGQRAATSSVGLSAVLGLLAGIPALTVPLADRVVLILYPARYLEAGSAFAYLVVGVSLVSALGVCATMFGGAGRPMTAVWILLVSLATQVAGGLWLVPRLGIDGAAISTVMAGLVGVGTSLAVLFRLFGTRLTRRVLVVVPVSAILAASLSVGFARLFPESRPLVTVAFLAVGYLVYLGLLLLGGVLLGDSADRVKKVLWVTKPLDPPFNDASKVLPATLARHVRPEAIAVCVANEASAGAAGLPAAVERLRLYGSTSSFAGRLLQNGRVLLGLWLHRFRFRALHFFLTPTFANSLAIRMLKLASPGVAFVQTITSRPRALEHLRLLCFGDTIVCGSDDTSRLVRQRLPNKRLALIRPGIDLRRALVAPELRWQGAAPASAARRESLAAHELDANAFHLLFAGDIEHGGALAHLMTSLPPLFACELPIQLHLSVRLKSPGTRARAQAFIDQLSTRWSGRFRVHWDHPQFEELLALQDAMIFPAEDLVAKLDAPLVILETLSMGKPVFCLDRAPINEIPPPALRSLLLAGDGEALAQLILAFVREPSSIPPQTLRRHIEEAFNAEHGARQVESLYQEDPPRHVG